jgi:hypothetical protein
MIFGSLHVLDLAIILAYLVAVEIGRASCRERV